MKNPVSDDLNSAFLSVLENSGKLISEILRSAQTNHPSPLAPKIARQVDAGEHPLQMRLTVQANESFLLEFYAVTDKGAFLLGSLDREAAPPTTAH